MFSQVQWPIFSLKHLLWASVTTVFSPSSTFKALSPKDLAACEMRMKNRLKLCKVGDKQGKSWVMLIRKHLIMLISNKSVTWLRITKASQKGFQIWKMTGQGTFVCERQIVKPFSTQNWDFIANIFKRLRKSLYMSMH